MSWTRVLATEPKVIKDKLAWYHKDKKELDKVKRKFHSYLKQFPEVPIPNSVGTPIKDKLESEIGREPTHEELKQYIRLVVMPTRIISLRRKQESTLINLINKNNERLKSKQI